MAWPGGVGRGPDVPVGGAIYGYIG